MNANSDEKIAKFKKIWQTEVEKKKVTDAKYADADIKENVDNFIRILPNKNPDLHFFLKSGYHKVAGDFVNCPKEVLNIKCPICEFVSRLYKSNTIEDLALARELKKVKRFYYNVIVRSAEDKGVRILTSGIKLFEKIIGACANPEIGDISDVNEGYDFIIRKRMKDNYLNYDLSEASRKQSPLSTDSVKATTWMNNLFDLEKEITILSYQELKTMLDNHLNSDSGTVTPTPQAQAQTQPAKQEAPIPVSAPSTPVSVETDEVVDEEIEAFKKNLEKLKGGV